MISDIRLEVMQTIEKTMDEHIMQYLIPVEKSWQPADLLPETNSDSFHEELKEIQGLARELDYDLWATLIGNTVTEEALPTYESWLMDVQGVSATNGWSKWIRQWTAEENRHGDLLNRYLYLSGRVNMREMEITIQYLIQDGMDLGTGRDPYKSFLYTSFQELATNIAHRRVATIAKNSGNARLAKICGIIASDELRHAKAYQKIIHSIFSIDGSAMMIAFSDMMKTKIVMPAHFLKESGGAVENLFSHFSEAAQRIKVYTTQDYIDILKDLIKEWNIAGMTELSGEAEKARDYLMALPQRLLRISERLITPEKQYAFKWIGV